MKRFYTEASVGEAEGGWRVLLDGRAIKTAAGKPQIVPARALAETLAQEWADQGEAIDPASFPLRDLARAQEAFMAKGHVGNIVVTMG